MMGIRINTNLASLNAQRHLGKAHNALNQSLARLSSGQRIITAADDAAGLLVSEQFIADIAGMKQASRNASDAVSMLQTADGALGEIGNILIRLRELAVQASSGHFTDTERGFLNDEFSTMKEEIDRIVEVTEYGSQKIIDGTFMSGVTFQVGIHSSSTNKFTVSMGDMGLSQIGSTASTARINSQSISNAAAAQVSLDVIDDAIEDIAKARGGIGAGQNRLQTVMNNLATSVENMTAANSRIRDVDVAEATANMTRNQILMQAGVAVLAQANQVPAAALSLLS